MAIRKSWAFTAAFPLACAAASAAVNFLATAPEGAAAQPPAMAWIHVGAAFFGSLCLARLLIGAPAALAGPPPQSMLARAEGPQRAIYKAQLSSKGHFFTLIRSAQILVVLFALMAQFVTVQPLQAEEGRGFCPIPHEPSDHAKPGRAPLTA